MGSLETGSHLVLIDLKEKNSTKRGKSLPEFSTTSQVALNPLRATEKSLWKVMSIVFPELRMGLGLLDPQYFSSPI